MPEREPDPVAGEPRLEGEEPVLSALLTRTQPTWGLPDTGAAERLAAHLGVEALVTREHRGELTVLVEPAQLIAALRFLRDAERYDLLSDAVGCDWLGYEGEVAGYWGDGEGRDLNRAGSWGKRTVPRRPSEKRFSVSYHLCKVLTVDDGEHRRLRLQTWVDDGEAVPTAIPVYPSVDFHEREIYDMFGIVFDGHPNLRRILMPQYWQGHPQRKDYPVGGEPVQFSEAR